MKSTLTIGFLAVGLALTGCSKNQKASSDASADVSASQSSAASNGQFEITANDSMKFSTTRLEAKPGQDLKVVFTNIGSMPKASMGHNWVLLKKDVDAKAFSDAAVAAAATEYLPADKMNQVIAHTKLLGPKQSEEISFKAPTEPGEYPFVCTFPAHFASGMKGVLVVK
jgi:azurin